MQWHMLIPGNYITAWGRVNLGDTVTLIDGFIASMVYKYMNCATKFYQINGIWQYRNFDRINVIGKQKLLVSHACTTSDLYLRYLLKHWGRGKITTICYTRCTNAFSWNVWIAIKISLQLVPKGPINNIFALVQIMSWRWPGDKPLFETTTVSLFTHKCITRLQWLNTQIKFPTLHGSQSWMFLYSCTVQISQSTLHPNEAKSHQCSSTIIQEMICCRMEQINHLSRCATLINKYQKDSTQCSCHTNDFAIN